MMRLLQCGTSLLFGTLLLVGLSGKAQSLDPKDIEGAWADQLSKAVINTSLRTQKELNPEFLLKGFYL
jgi:hypothetical protein